MYRSAETVSILTETFSQFKERFRRTYGKGDYHAAAVYRAVFRSGNPNIRQLPEFAGSPALAGRITDDLVCRVPEIVEEVHEGSLAKQVFRLSDGLLVEAVIVPMENYTTVCISSQVGCRMGCRFCETAQMGFVRNLTVAEIVGQVYQVKVRKGLNLRNVVFMGMGEPLDNLDNVVQAIRVLEDQRGLDIAKRHMTVSTAGVVPGIRALAGLNWSQLKLAVSLNASNDEVRDRIMPINRRHNMTELKTALLAFPLAAKSHIFMEYVQIKGINDLDHHARQLATYLHPLKVKLNLIPYNPRRDSPFPAPGLEDVNRFHDRLVDQHIFVRKRSTKGQHILAACGQLGARSAGGYS
ncbi:MAG: 23S rRNA (adenine(2503)-C(2))-methyltransferase RlmN [Desulfobacteraceae bacterium]|nr:23S rRNA (adenine(2503)-C(2))-methyltransferase RlmN [Desulfobacteraceae bacterium]